MLREYYDDWHLLFENARTFNEPGSTIVNSANYLEGEVKCYLHAMACDSELPRAKDLPEPSIVVDE